MASIGEPIRKILTQPGHDPLEQLLNKIQVNNEGDQEYLLQPNVSVIASSTTTGAFSITPPQDQTDFEWIPQLIQVRESALFDPLDRVIMLLVDDLISTSIPVFSARGVNNTPALFPFTSYTWPFNIALGNALNQDIVTEYTPLRLFRKINGETWRRIRIDIQTTGTPGTRAFTLVCIYRRRPSTRI
jgi:hypothetical protein